MSSSSGDNVSDGGYGENIYLQGETHTTRKGFQTIYVAGLAHGAAQDYGTNVTLNMAASANVAADTTGASVSLTTTGASPLTIFQPGDIVVGHTGGPEMEVVSVDSATQMTVKNVTEQIDHAEELLPKNPVIIHLGIEY